MGTNFAVGDKLRILEGYVFDGKTGVIIKDGGLQNLGFRKLGEGKYSNSLQMWIVKLDDIGDEVSFPEGALKK